MKSISIKTILMACFVLTICGCEQNQNTPDDSNSNSNNNSDISVKGFTVEDGRQVVFAPGNLQYQASTKTWRFAEEQYDYIGEDNEKTSSTYSGWIDLFEFGTGNAPTKVSTSSSDYSEFIDWGHNTIGTDPKNTWRTLTSDEWRYVTTYRPNAPKLLGLAAVKGISGLILLPDEWGAPDGIEFNPGVDNCTYTNNLYSSAQWKQMETAGAVFLPAAGNRFSYSTNYSDVIYSTSNGYYWSSSWSDEGYFRFLYYLHFEGNSSKYSSISVESQADSNHGYSVRLAKDL